MIMVKLKITELHTLQRKRCHAHMAWFIVAENEQRGHGNTWDMLSPTCSYLEPYIYVQILVTDRCICVTIKTCTKMDGDGSIF